MIPSTALLLAGVLIFDPIEFFIMDMVGILTSSTIVYYLSRYMGFVTYFETRHRKYIQKIRNGFRNNEVPIIVGWSFFPFVPTDLIVYVGSTLEVSVFNCLLGVFIGNQY